MRTLIVLLTVLAACATANLSSSDPGKYFDDHFPVESQDGPGAIEFRLTQRANFINAVDNFHGELDRMQMATGMIPVVGGNLRQYRRFERCPKPEFKNTFECSNYAN